MECELIDSELVNFQFGRVSDGIRTSVEKHLLGCETCLESFLFLKRNVEATTPVSLPDASVKRRLMNEVRRIELEHLMAGRSRFLPRSYRRFAIPVLLLMLTLTAWHSFRSELPKPEAPISHLKSQSIDSARELAVSLSLY